MKQDIVFEIVFLLVGLGLIVSAIKWQQRLGRQEVIDITVDKLGLILKANAFGLLVLFGFVIIGAGFFFLYKGYESQLNKLQEEGRELKLIIAQKKTYDMRLSLIFPDDDQANPQKVTKTSAYVRKHGDPNTRPYLSVISESGDGGFIVHFQELTIGDTLYVTVQQEDKKWKSEAMTVPSTKIAMQRIKD